MLSQLEASVANKESFFARMLAENESRPEGVPPSKGSKYVGFESNLAPSQGSNNPQNDVISVVSQGFGKLSLVAASTAQSAANVVQQGTKDITTKVRDGGYDYKVNETVNVVTQKTSEIGQRTWGIMKGVIAMASQKVEEYTRENSTWKPDNWQRNESDRNGYYQNFNQENIGWNSSTGRGQSSSGGQSNTYSSSSWDDWDHKDTRKEEPAKGSAPHNSDAWAGWDDAKDDGYDNFYDNASNKKAVGHNGKSDSTWTGGGFL